MDDLIHRIVGIIIEAGQSDTKKFRLGETIRYTPSEIMEILKQHESEIFEEDIQKQGEWVLLGKDDMDWYQTRACSECDCHWLGHTWEIPPKRCPNCRAYMKDVPDICIGNMISRQFAIDDIETVNPSMPLSINWVKNWIKALPPAQPTVLNAKKLCEFWDSESNFCALHRPSAQPEPHGVCMDCLMKNVCRFKTGLGDYGYCSQWKGAEYG